MPHGKICYLEIPANRAEDSARFYSGACFGRRRSAEASGLIDLGMASTSASPPHRGAASSRSGTHGQILVAVSFVW